MSAANFVLYLWSKGRHVGNTATIYLGTPRVRRERKVSLLATRNDIAVGMIEAALQSSGGGLRQCCIGAVDSPLLASSAAHRHLRSRSS